MNMTAAFKVYTCQFQNIMVEHIYNYENLNFKRKESKIPKSHFILNYTEFG